MARYIERGDSLFIPFRNGKSISDSQCKPRMYKSLQNFEKAFPKHNHGTKGIELVEYAEVKHGKWLPVQYTYFGFKRYECSECKDDEYWQKRYIEHKETYCPNCGAKMDGGKTE